MSLGALLQRKGITCGAGNEVICFKWILWTLYAGDKL